MSYYLEVSEDGTETKVPKKKGPTRKGWIKNEEVAGEYIRDINVSVAIVASYIYIRFDNDTGVYANHKPVGRGRRSMGYVKFMNIEGELKLAPGENLPKNVDTLTIPAEVGLFVSKVSAVIPIPSEKIGFDELHSCLKAGRFEKDGSKHTYKLVDVVGDPKIPYLQQNRAVSRIEVNTETGEIAIWNIEYTPDKPDALISDALK